MYHLRTISIFCILFLLTPALQANEPARDPAAELIHLLDYIGVDYPGTVANGKVINPDEYNEMQEFVKRVAILAQKLPASEGRVELLNDAARLQDVIRKRADGKEATRLTAAMQQEVIRLTGIVTSPRRPPSLTLGKALFLNHCAACHGAEGLGDGPAATGLSPAPSNFHDHSRQDKRSVYGLYNTITLGVADTAMRGYGELSIRERWALASYVGSLAFEPEQIKTGQQIWEQAADREMIPNLAALTSMTTEDARNHFGEDGVVQFAYLRNHPEVLGSRVNALDKARDLLAQSLAAFTAGNPKKAYRLAVASYLDGFETAEAGLRNLDPALVAAVERNMATYRNHVTKQVPLKQVEEKAADVNRLLEQAQQMLASTSLSPGMTFASSMVILLREGLEALLVLAAIITLLIKADRRDALPWVHIGWISALALGALTWWASRYVISISGANREVTEGLTALLATSILLYVGFWLHSKTHARSWQKFLQEKIHGALQGKTLFALSGIAFLAVYREIFETVLFYEALAQQTDPVSGLHMLWMGLLAGAAVLGVLGWILLRTGLRLPLRQFFNVNAFLLFALAIIFTGQGIAALQEAGYIGVMPLNLPRFEWVGFYPTMQTVLGQVVILMLIGGLFWWERYRNRQESI